jgi:hypothetical protein
MKTPIEQKLEEVTKFVTNVACSHDQAKRRIADFAIEVLKEVEVEEYRKGSCDDIGCCDPDEYVRENEIDKNNELWRTRRSSLIASLGGDK